jgi:hypothetical protein
MRTHCLSDEVLTYTDDRNLRRGWHRCLEKAGIRSVRFHDLRHTFVSQLIATGAPSKYVTVQADHGSSQVTQDIYGHLFPDGNRQWVARLDVTSSAALSDTPMIHAARMGNQESEQPSDKPLDSEENLLVAVPRIERGTRGL